VTLARAASLTDRIQVIVCELSALTISQVMLVAIHPWDCAGAKEVLLNSLPQSLHGTMEGRCNRCICHQHVHVYHRHGDAPMFLWCNKQVLV